MRKTNTLILLIIFIVVNQAFSREDIATSNRKPLLSNVSGCIATTAQVDLNINNVRARILNG